MNRTYKAVQVTQPGKLEVVESSIIEPHFGQVRILVEACGVCHTDALTVEGGFPGLTYPRVPGEEVIGKIETVGSGAQGWKEGQRVGVGYMGGHCGYCENCRRGDFVNCQNQPISGTSTDGGYAEMMITQASGLAVIPDGLLSTEAAPLLCAGLTTFNRIEKLKGSAWRTRCYSRSRWARAPRNSVCAVHGLSSRSHCSRPAHSLGRDATNGKTLKVPNAPEE